jgi:translation initiation factor 4G
MLGIWQSLSDKEKIVPTSVQNLCACRVDVPTRHPKKKGPRKDSQALVPGTGAYKPFQSGQDLKKNILALLNKISPENFDTIVDQFEAVELKDSEELSTVIKMIFQQVLRQPFYCKTYADMVHKLQQRYQATPFENGVTFRRLLINACQEEFENLSASLLFPTDGLTREDVLDERKRRKDRVLANMKFIGYLYLRKMIALKVIGGIVQELIAFDGSSDEFPQEEQVECALELVQAVGLSLDQLQDGHVLMTRFMSRLTHLKVSEVDGRRVYTKRVQFQIQDVVELRAANWKR